MCGGTRPPVKSSGRLSPRCPDSVTRRRPSSPLCSRSGVEFSGQGGVRRLAASARKAPTVLWLTSWMLIPWRESARPSAPRKRRKDRLRGADVSHWRSGGRTGEPRATKGVDLEGIRHSRGYQVLVKVGLASYSVVHLLVAWLTVNVALGERGNTSPGGALQQVAKRSIWRLVCLLSVSPSGRRPV